MPSDAQKKATKRYLEKFEEVRVRVPLGQRALIEAHVKNHGDKSINAFLVRAISQTMDRDLGNDMDGCHGEDNTPETE